MTDRPLVRCAGQCGWVVVGLAVFFGVLALEPILDFVRGERISESFSLRSKRLRLGVSDLPQLDRVNSDYASRDSSENHSENIENAPIGRRAITALLGFVVWLILGEFGSRLVINRDVHTAAVGRALINAGNATLCVGLALLVLTSFTWSWSWWL